MPCHFQFGIGLRPLVYQTYLCASIFIFLQLYLRPLTQAAETGSRNRHLRPKSDARFWRLFFMPMLLISPYCLRAPKAVNNVRSRASARKTGAGIWRWIYSEFLERVAKTCCPHFISRSPFQVLFDSLFLCVLATSTVVFVWQCSHHFTKYVLAVLWSKHSVLTSFSR